MNTTEIYNFDETPDRLGSDCIKWRMYSPDVIPMWVADMDFVSPEPVVQALKARVDHRVFGYPAGIGDSPKEWTEFRQSIVNRMKALYGWEITKADIVFIPGVVTGFNLACHAFASPQEGVLIQTPVYPPILHAAGNTGRQFQEMELSLLPDGRYEVDWDAFETSFTASTRVMILCNPHNPVGKVFTRTELERTAEICLRNDTIIISDEIHNDLIFRDFKHIPIAALDPEIAASTITLMSPSKTYNLAGLQCSYAIIQNKKLRKQFLASKKGLVPWVNLMGMVAGEAALRDGGGWFEQVMDYLEGNKEYVHEFVINELPGINMAEPQGTYLAWLDCRSAGIPEKRNDFFIKEARVAFNEGSDFGKGGEGFVRLNFGCSRKLLETALNRLKKTVGGLE